MCIADRDREFGHCRVAGCERNVGEVVGSTVDGGGEFWVGAALPVVQGRLGFGSGEGGFDGSCSFTEPLDVRPGDHVATGVVGGQGEAPRDA